MRYLSSWTGVPPIFLSYLIDLAAIINFCLPRLRVCSIFSIFSITFWKVFASFDFQKWFDLTRCYWMELDLCLETATDLDAMPLTLEMLLMRGSCF